jgi:hypothetical protein
MIYLIGVEHNKTQYEYQDGSNKDFVALFTNFIRKQIAELNTTIIAEELNIESLEQQKVTESTAKKLQKNSVLNTFFVTPLPKRGKISAFLQKLKLQKNYLPKRHTGKYLLIVLNSR